VSTRTSALDALIFGVDVQSGDVRGDAPAYALVVYDGEEFERDVVSLRKLRRLIDDRRPDIVATDNVYELAPDKQGLVHLLSELPDETRLVQVTGAERPEPLSRVASRHDVPYGKDPMQEAEAAARLAARNVGQVVSAFTNTTQVKVSRGRSTGKGGWSEDRFTRRIHGAVRRKARQVESALDDAGLDYEKDVTEKYGGFSNATFAVDAHPTDIPVSRVRAGDVRVEMERVRRDGIEFGPLAKRRDYVLVGIDPGTTTAVALVDLDGRVLDTFSTRTADTAEVIEWIIERGRPVVVAADVAPMPETVEKIRRSFDAAGWTPTADLPVDEKLHRTREHDYANDHERDALAAALFAHDDHKDQFARVASKVPPNLGVEEVIARVVAGEESVEAVLRDLTADDEGTEDEDSESGSPDSSPEPNETTRLRSRIERLESHVETLNDTIAEKDDRIDDLEGELSDARREERREARERREITRLERETDRLERKLDEQRAETAALEEKLERLKELWKIDHSDFADVAEGRGLVSVKPVEKFTRDAIRAAQEDFGIAPGDVVYLRDASGAGASTAELLADLEPRIVLKRGGLSEAADEILFDRDIPVGPAADVTIQEIDELAVAKETEVEAAIDDWEARAEERRRQQNAEMVDRLISEHRAEGRKGESD
jgi:predicted RNase H-like nuclease (RuvC/YqgF family)